MRKYVSLVLAGCVAFAACFGTMLVTGSRTASAAPVKIALSPSMVTNLSVGHGDPTLLVDEQLTKAGDPAAGSGGLPSTGWHAGWTGSYYPLEAYIDLGQTYDLTDIYLFDSSSSGSFTVSAGTPGNFTPLFIDTLGVYNQWKAHPVTVTTRYIGVTMGTMNSWMNEIVVYGTPSAGADTTAPAAVLLSAPSSTSNSVTLAWTAPGDDNNTGTATSYDVRYSMSPINDGNWAGAMPANGEPTPSAAGSSETMTIAGLSASTTYYFALKTADEASNVSPLSTPSLSKATSAPPVDAAAPAAIANLAASSSTSDSVTLTWTAPGDDGNTGTASSYDVRYGIADINDGNWASAAQANGEPAPSVAGSAETMTVTGLSPNTTYYFKIKTADEVPNVSAISTTTVSMATAASGTDTIAPAAIADLQAVAGGTSTTANLQWTASGDDNNTGTAASYDVRYRTTPFTTSNWSSAKKATFLPSPQPAGSVETMTVYGLTPSTLYYFALTATDDAGNESLLSTGTVSYTTLAPTSGTAIVLYPGMVFNEQGRGEADMLVDEPSDPRGGTPTTPTSIWNYGSNNFYYPISVIIDLGIPYQLTDIYYYDGVGSGADGVTFSTGSPAGWTDHFTDKLGQTNKWVGHSFHATTRYVRLYMDECCQKIGEIALYGTPIGTPPAAPTPTPHTRPTMNELMGVNALVDDPADKMAVVEHIREYHNWDWDEGDYNFGSNGNPAAYAGAYPNNLNKFAPTYANSGGWNFDSFYSSLHSGGFTILPAVQASVSWLTPNRWDKPLSAGDSATDPASYVEHADHMFQYAARYGGASVADAKLKLAAGQPRSSGLGTIDYIENANEPDKWWQGLSAYFTPYEFAAMSSADYDGHLGAMGNTAGVKNADASLQMVMGGLTEVKLDYIKALKFWADYYRGGSIPFDVINVHHYSNANPDSNTIGISPEQDKFKEKMEKLVQYRDMYMPNHPVWLTEFGYDTHPNSVQRAPVIGTKSQEGVQADWLVRSYLAAAASGLDRAYAYFLRDANPGSTTKYDTAGLVKGKGDWSPKVSWYYVYTLRNTLGNMRYLAEQSSSTNNLLIYKFKNATGNGGAYAVWLGTSNGGTVANYSLSLSGSPTSATKVTMAAGYTDGVSTPLAISGGTVTVNVSETPIFIVVDDMQ